jgi:hypothetical protein
MINLSCLLSPTDHYIYESSLAQSFKLRFSLSAFNSVYSRSLLLCQYLVGHKQEIIRFLQHEDLMIRWEWLEILGILFGEPILDKNSPWAGYLPPLCLIPSAVLGSDVNQLKEKTKGSRSPRSLGATLLFTYLYEHAPMCKVGHGARMY